MNEAAEIYKRYLCSNWLMETSNNGNGPTFISTVTGSTPTTHELQSAEYWVANLVNPVRFSDVVSMVVSSAQSTHSNQGVATVDYILEIGPHSALRSPIRDILRDIGKDVSTCYSSTLIRNQDACETMLDSMGRLHCFGHEVNLTAVNRELGGRKRPSMLSNLPPYPFNHSQKYWVESRLDQDFRFRKAGRHEVIGNRASDWNDFEARWNNRLIVQDTPWLADHKVSLDQLRTCMS